MFNTIAKRAGIEKHVNPMPSAMLVLQTCWRKDTINARLEKAGKAAPVAQPIHWVKLAKPIHIDDKAVLRKVTIVGSRGRESPLALAAG